MEVSFGGKTLDSIEMTHKALAHMREQLSTHYKNIDPWCPSHGRSYSKCEAARG